MNIAFELLNTDLMIDQDAMVIDRYCNIDIDRCIGRAVYWNECMNDRVTPCLLSAAMEEL